MNNLPIPMLIITGPVGVGKTTAAFAVSDILNERGIPHAVVDQDALRQCYPSPADDPFHIALGLRNLAAVWRNYHEAGAQRLILVDVVETREQREDYQQAIPGAVIQIVRLSASLATLLRRLEGREVGANLDWHQKRAAELIALMDDRRVEDILIDTDDKPISAVAREILERAGWR